eukprot:PhF_6_TR4732/c0_g1_i1/m.6544
MSHNQSSSSPSSSFMPCNPSECCCVQSKCVEPSQCDDWAVVITIVVIVLLVLTCVVGGLVVWYLRTKEGNRKGIINFSTPASTPMTRTALSQTLQPTLWSPPVDPSPVNVT